MLIRLHPDGHVYLGEFRASLAEIRTVRPSFTPPAGAMVLEYDGRRSVLVDPDGNQKSGPLPWADGDQLLANAAAWIAAIEASRPVASPTEPAALSAEEAADIDAMKRLRGKVLLATETPSDIREALNRLLAKFIR